MVSRMTMPSYTLFFVFVSAFLHMACVSHSHNYGPIGTGVPNSAGPLAAEAFYPVNVDDGKGSLRLRSQGVVDLRAKGTQERRPALHMSAVLANTNGEQTWSFEPREQIVIFPDHGQVAAIALNPNSFDLEIKPGESRTVELYFPIPNGLDSELHEFDVKWNVSVGKRAVSESTTFAKRRERMQAHDSFGMGSGWYYGTPIYYPSAPAIRVRK